MGNKIDRRVKYTKFVLKNALAEILNEKPIDKITVKEICERADINRGTFYSHYSGQYDLYTNVVDELFSGVIDNLGDFMAKSEDDIYSSVVCVFEYIKANNILIKTLLNSGVEYSIEKRVRSAIKDVYLKKVKDNIDDDFLDATYSYISAGATAAIRHWLNGGMKKSTEEMAEFIVKLTTEGLDSFQR